MNKQQSGFTLIELVVVIVILGILAATALPKFVDLSGEAETAAVQGVAGAISSAAAINYAKYKASGTAPVVISDGTNACTGASNSLLAGYTSLLAGSGAANNGIVLQTAVSTSSTTYQVGNGSPIICAAGVTVTCTLTSKSGKVATAALPCTN